MPRVFFLLGTLLIEFFCYPVFAFSVVDDAKTKVVLDQPATRIITLAPDSTEVLYEIGAGNAIIATVAGSDYPKAARHIKRIGSYAGIDTEAIMALQPDLIIAWGHQFADTLRYFKSKQVPVYVSQPKTLEDIASTMQRLGVLSGHEVVAKQKATAFMQALAAIKQRYQWRHKQTVFFQVGDYSLFSINKESWINQVITLCGGVNIFWDAKVIAPLVSMESVLERNPEVIITDGRASDWQSFWRKHPTLAAVQHDRLISVHPDLIDRAGPRIIQGTEFICTHMSSRATLSSRA